MCLCIKHTDGWLENIKQIANSKFLVHVYTCWKHKALIGPVSYSPPKTLTMFYPGTKLEFRGRIGQVNKQETRCDGSSCINIIVEEQPFRLNYLLQKNRPAYL